MTYELAFPRTDSPLVTFLFPTRGRPDWLYKSVESLHTRAAQPNKLEFIFRVDTDDHNTIQTATTLCDFLPNARMIVDKRGAGYFDMHLMVNTTCKLARGDWVIIWNDDAMMATEQWDEVLCNIKVPSWHNVPDVYMLVPPVVGRPGCTEFMFLRRKVVEILGHFSLSPHNDNWITRVMGGVKSWAWLTPINIEHHSGVIGDQTRKESEAAYGNGALARATLESEEAQKNIWKDIHNLAVFIKNTTPASERHLVYEQCLKYATPPYSKNVSEWKDAVARMHDEASKEAEEYL